MRVALVADWLPLFAGAEHVIAELLKLWPDAPVFTTVARKSALGPLANADIRVSALQFPFSLLRQHRILLPWMPMAMEAIDLRGYDVIISSSHAVGKGIIPPGDAVHICYCHTPMRYAWEMEAEYLVDFRIPRPLQRPVKKFLKGMRRWDMTTAKRTDVFLANSGSTQNRIREIYRRESVVIPPPAHDRFFAFPLPSRRDQQNHPYLAIGRLVPYKRFDFLITYANTYGLPITIAGTGPEERRLRRMAGSTVRFLGFVPEEDLPRLYAHARALLFPQHEDAGIVPLEAQACGTPVIAFARGGVLDAVRDDLTGILFSEQTLPSFRDALARFEKTSFDPLSIRTHAERFSSRRFRESILEIVQNTTGR
ncbi:MAG: glycosyltransferase [Candidatus Peregrinibacteria bacterium]